MTQQRIKKQPLPFFGLRLVYTNENQLIRRPGENAWCGLSAQPIHITAAPYEVRFFAIIVGTAATHRSEKPADKYDELFSGQRLSPGGKKEAALDGGLIFPGADLWSHSDHIVTT
ncbi:hypothetical protein [Klebsiella pneumoniae]|uniref:hypothetical protein n=1 Tax=Klebsiella pneumoniae TaxID=573 RepID=UPI001ABD2D02|nr:hypothetical protein [Klebsiella pneumoniae]MBO3721233.1 hypothetical protein [Klebsiella pneumoniae]HCM5830645.1 hypothetical protein [Klebsiella pneumoniae]